MSIDFESLVLGPCMTAFAKPVTITPVKSQSLAAPYPSQGIWTIDSVDLVMEDGTPMTSRTIKFGVQFSDYPIMLAQGDIITTIASNVPLAYWQGDNDINPSSNIDFIVNDQRPDGQGGCTLVLKRRVVR